MKKIFASVIICSTLLFGGCSTFEEFLKYVEVEAPVTPPAPAQSPDAVPADSVVWDEAVSPAKWPITAKISSTSMYLGGTKATLSGTDNWPVRNDGGAKPTIGNWWIIATCSDGKIHGATYEWLGKGKNSTSGQKWDGADDIHGCVGTDMRPKAGDVFWMMVSTVGRSAPYTIQERTKIIEVIFK